MDNKPVIKVSAISKSFKGRTVVDQLSIDVYEGDILGLLGPNGAGKTTAIRMILNLIKKDSGQVTINGYNSAVDTKEALFAVGCTLETPSFYDYLTGYENLELMANLYDDVDQQRISEVLKLVSLSARAKDKVKVYSSGMRQRLGLARTLLNKPKLVILDEPTNGLDPQGMRDIYELIQKLSRQEKIAFIISSHLLHDIEQICNKLVIIDQGKTILKGETEELLAENNETVEIETKEIDELAQALQEVVGVRIIERRNSGFVLDLAGTTFSELNEYLVNKDIPIENIVKSRPSLEKLFLNLTTKEGVEV